MTLIYNFLLKSYSFVILIVSPFNKKASLWIKGRKNIFKKIKSDLNEGDKTIWFHVSSLGEFEQGRPVIEKLKAKYPQYKIVLTFFSPSGYEVQKNYENADHVYYLPQDSKRNAKRFIEIINPTMAVFVKYEFWHHYLNQLHKANIPTYIVSAIFRPSQLFFKPYGKWYRNMLTKFSYLFVQNKESLQLLSNIGINNAEIGGDTRFDRVFEISQNSKELPLVKEFTKDTNVIIGGSTWEKDELLLISYFKTNNSGLKMILAPHEVHDKNIERIINLAPGKILRYSQANANNIDKYPILIIDCIGILSSLYRYGDIAYIGNGFGDGIHNTLEPATFGMPVIFGPNYKRYQEACDLVKLEAGFSVENEEMLTNIFNSLFSDKKMMNHSQKSSLEYVKSMCGGTEKFLSKIASNKVL